MTTTASEPILLLFNDTKLRKLSASDMTDFFKTNLRQDFRKMSEFFAGGVVAKCPESWGSVSDPKTFARRPFLTEYKEIIRQFVSATDDLESETDDKPLAVTFDFTRLTGEETTDFFEAARTRNYVLMAAVFAKVVKSCPASWGAPDQAKTYFNRPHFSDFVKLVKLFGDQLNEESKNS